LKTNAVERRLQNHGQRRTASLIEPARRISSRRRISGPAHQRPPKAALSRTALKHCGDIVQGVDGRARRRQNEDRQGRNDLGEDHGRGHQGHDLEGEGRAR
jgi:hypothetical protein